MKKILLILLLFTIQIAAQEKDHEVNSEVKELTDFHDIIYQIWHTAWPEKDIKMLKSLVPDIEKGFASIKSAELPGILRDKKMKWEEGLNAFAECVDNYKSAAAKDDSAGLMNAAEKLHSQFEGMVRIIRPMVKELDAFHQVLYMLYHYYLPDYEFDKIKESAGLLAERMEALNSAKLSSRLQAKQKQFDTGRIELEVAVKKLNEVVKAGDDKPSVTKAVDLVHTKYETLEKVFD